MIISASRRTDIPAFYAEWFVNRIREGYACVTNPFNPRQHSAVDLSPRAVDAIVFWTKDPAPLMPHLVELDARGYNYYFLYTITGYPRAIEPSVPPLERNVETFKALSERLGPGRVLWRFDPVLVSTATPENVIAGAFEEIARRLNGYADRVIISFTHFYKKTVASLNALSEETGMGFYDVSCDLGVVQRIASSLSGLARNHSLRIFSCAGKHDLAGSGIEPARCVDGGLIEEQFGVSLNVKKDSSQRKECGCVESRDIGQYNTCAHGCVYCYANTSKNLARRNLALHDPQSPFLLKAFSNNSFRSESGRNRGRRGGRGNFPEARLWLR